MIKRALNSIFRNFGISIATIISTVITLLLVGSFLGIIYNVNNISNSIEDSSKISVFMKSNFSENQNSIEKTKKNILSVSNVTDATFSTKDEELNKLIAQFGKDGQILETYKNDNPLSSTYTISIRDKKLIEETSNNITKIDDVQEVNFGGLNVKKLFDFISSLKIFGLIFVLILLIMSTFLIHNVIKIGIISKSDEIEIMRLVGASNTYIRAPFIVEALILGYISTLIAVGAIFGIYTLIYTNLHGVIISSSIKLVDPMYYALSTLAVSVIVSTLISFIGAVLSMRKFLKI